MKTLVSRFVKDESGATAIEYGLIAAGISVAIIAVVQGLGTKLSATFQGLGRVELTRVRHFMRKAPASSGAFSFCRLRTSALPKPQIFQTISKKLTALFYAAF